MYILSTSRSFNLDKVRPDKICMINWRAYTTQMSFKFGTMLIHGRELVECERLDWSLGGGCWEESGPHRFDHISLKKHIIHAYTGYTKNAWSDQICHSRKPRREKLISPMSSRWTVMDFCSKPKNQYPSSFFSKGGHLLYPTSLFDPAPMFHALILDSFFLSSKWSKRANIS